jgi:hypothetical protein
MNRYDMLVLVLVLELGHSAGLAHELPLDGRKAILILGRRRANQSIDAFAHLVWETFLDHNQPVQTVACHIGYAKTAALKLLFDHILPVQKSHTNAQCIGRMSILDLGYMFQKWAHLGPSFRITQSVAWRSSVG